MLAWAICQCLEKGTKGSLDAFGFFYINCFFSTVTKRKGHALSILKDCSLEEYDGYVYFMTTAKNNLKWYDSFWSILAVGWRSI